MVYEVQLSMNAIAVLLKCKDPGIANDSTSR